MQEADELQERLAHEIAFEFEEGQALGRMFAVTVGHFWDLNNMKSFRDKHSRTTDEEWHDLLEIELSNGDRVPAALLVEIMDPDRTRWEPSTFYEASALQDRIFAKHRGRGRQCRSRHHPAWPRPLATRLFKHLGRWRNRNRPIHRRDRQTWRRFD